ADAESERPGLNLGGRDQPSAFLLRRFFVSRIVLGVAVVVPNGPLRRLSSGFTQTTSPCSRRRRARNPGYRVDFCEPYRQTLNSPVQRIRASTTGRVSPP